MGKDWDKGVPGVPFWKEMLRITKPGAMLLAMGGTRTYHRLVCTIEDAGWEIRDMFEYLYGSGFPKSHNLAKAIQTNLWREFLSGVLHLSRKDAGYQCGCSSNCRQCGAPLHDEADTAQHVALLPADAQERNHLFETLTDTLQGIEHKCTASSCGLSSHLSKQDCQNHKDADVWLLILAVSSCLCPACFAQLFEGVSFREGHQDGIDWSSNDALSAATVWDKSDIFYRIFRMSPEPYNHYITELENWKGYGSSLKPAHEPICVAQKPRDGTYVENALKWGVAGMWIDGARVESGQDYQDTERFNDRKTLGGYGSESIHKAFKPATGRWPANVILSYPDDEYGLRDNVTPKQLNELARWLDENA
jgi:hypothetical protein